MNHADLLERCQSGLHAALPPGAVVETRPAKARPGGPYAGYGWMRLRGPWGALEFPYEAKGHVGDANIAVVDRRMRGDDEGGRTETPTWILLTDYVNGNLARRLRQGGIAFADAEGNAHVWGPGLHVWVTGNRPKVRATTTPGLARAAAARVLFVLLQDPHRALNPYREVAAQAGVAPDTVHRVFEDLRVKGYLKVGEGRERTLTRVAELHELWITAYENELRPKLRPKRFQQLGGGPVEEMPLPQADRPNAATRLLGGEAAAAELTETLRPTTATLHTPPGGQGAVMKALGLVPLPDGPITLLDTFGTTNEWRQGTGLRLADPLLIHAELLRIGDDRAREAAAELYDRHIKVRFAGA